MKKNLVNAVVNAVVNKEKHSKRRSKRRSKHVVNKEKRSKRRSKRRSKHVVMENTTTSSIVNTTSLFIELPLDLIVLIASYLSMKDQRTLSHCSKSYRTMLKDANLIRYKLSKESCERYVNDLVTCVGV